MGNYKYIWNNCLIWDRICESTTTKFENMKYNFALVEFIFSNFCFLIFLSTLDSKGHEYIGEGKSLEL